MSSAVLSTTPHFPHLPNSPTIQGEGSSISARPGFENSAGLRLGMIKIFDDMRHLTHLLTNLGHSITPMELISFDKVRISIQHRLVSLVPRKPNQSLHDLDYVFEACRIAALIFLNRVLVCSWPVCPWFGHLGSQLKDLLLEHEGHNIHGTSPQVHRVYYIWMLSIGGIHSLANEDAAFFAQRVAVATRLWRVQGFGSWSEILSRVKGVCWTDALQGPECDRFGERVERFIAGG